MCHPMIRWRTPTRSTADIQLELRNSIIICGLKVKTSQMKSQLRYLISSLRRSRFWIHTLSSRIFVSKRISLDHPMTLMTLITIINLLMTSTPTEIFVLMGMSSKGLTKSRTNALMDLNSGMLNIVRSQLT